MLMAANMPDRAYQVIARAYSLPTSADSLGNRLPLATPETFDLGLVLIDYMKSKRLLWRVTMLIAMRDLML